MVRPYLALAIATCMNQTRRQTRSRSVVFQKFQQPVLIFIGSHSWSVGCVQIEHPGHGNSWLLDRVELYEISDGNHGLWAKQSSLFWMESYTGGGYPKQLRITSMLTWMGKKNCKTKIRGKRRNSYIYIVITSCSLGNGASLGSSFWILSHPFILTSVIMLARDLKLACIFSLIRLRSSTILRAESAGWGQETEERG